MMTLLSVQAAGSSLVVRFRRILCLDSLEGSRPDSLLSFLSFRNLLSSSTPELLSSLLLCSSPSPQQSEKRH
jgi:hypothetical protein